MIYRVKVKYVFTGTFDIETDSKADAKEQAEQHCGLVIGGNIHTSSPDVIDWKFDVHPDKIIGSAKKI